MSAALAADIFYELYVCFNRQKKCQVRNTGSQRASAGYSRMKCIVRQYFMRFFDARECLVSPEYLPKLPPFNISFISVSPLFLSIGTIRYSFSSPNTSCITNITAPANFLSPNLLSSWSMPSVGIPSSCTFLNR